MDITLSDKHLLMKDGPGRIPLMEVFNLIYLSHDELEPEKQCGTIKMISDGGVQFLYNVQDIDMSKPTIKYGDDILVTVKGPTCSFMCLDMQFDMFSGAYKDSIEVEWDSNESVADDVLFEERRIVSRDGTGEICVMVGLFFDATVACLGVKLVDNSSATNVYGVILASNSKLDIPKCTSVLFEKKPDNVIQVGDDGLIPLSKSRVGVPMNSVLYVDISLNVNGVNYTASSSFDAKKTGEFSEVYSSENRVVFQVQVTWDAKKNSIYSTYENNRV